MFIYSLTLYGLSVIIWPRMPKETNQFLCSLCDPPKKCTNAQGVAAHMRMVHPDEFKKSHPEKTEKKSVRKYKKHKPSNVSLADAINALEVKLDTLKEVIDTLKEML